LFSQFCREEQPPYNKAQDNQQTALGKLICYFAEHMKGYLGQASQENPQGDCVSVRDCLEVKTKDCVSFVRLVVLACHLDGAGVGLLERRVDADEPYVNVSPERGWQRHF